MQALLAKGLAFAHGDAAPLLDQVDFHLTPGWYGLVGANGSGKTTLLRILARELRPDAGRVRLEPEDAIVVVCAQDVHRLSEDIAALAEREDSDAHRLRATLDLDAAALARWPTLSPGERKRWQVGGALAREPDVLLLDEPTNHLDARGRDWLAAALRRFRGIGVVVSHDRALLVALTRATLRIRAGRVELMPGSYDDAKREWEREAREAQTRRDGLRAERDAAERRLADARRDRASAEKAISPTMKGPRDHDGRSMARKGMARRAEKSIARVVGARRTALERAGDRLASEEPVVRERGAALFVDWESAPRARVLSAHLPELRAGDRVLARDIALDVARDARIRVAGPNGAGKSTLLAALMKGGANLDAARVLFLPQDTPPAEDARALDDVRALDPIARGRVLAFVAALGVDPERLLASKQPSPGEARKLRIAAGLGRRVWALVLDEPTNHLDLPSIERLERALEHYPGALVVVTHDDAFARACSCETWRIEGERVVRE
ncbi:MAG: ATP-binding cassette domain-containing protein [Polyangiaceae bacterium]